MILKQICFASHPFFGQQSIRFPFKKSLTADFNLFVGNNGVGKTILLKAIFNTLTQDQKSRHDISFDLDESCFTNSRSDVVFIPSGGTWSVELLEQLRNLCRYDLSGNLSSGERQLLILKKLRVDNSIIMIDTPEFSLHPREQQNIVKWCKQMGENNQFFIATHSPHVIGSVPTECLRILKKKNGRVFVESGDELPETYGRPVDIILKEIMGLDSVRVPEVTDELKECWRYINSEKFEDSVFQEKYSSLEEMLGSEDEDMLLMRLEIAKLKVRRNSSE